MSIAGILGSNLFSAGAAQNTLDIQKSSTGAPKFEQIKNEFQQLGQDLQSGNLTQAQADYTTLSSNFPGASQSSATAAATTSAATAATTAAITAATTATTPPPAAITSAGQTTVVQQFTQLGQDLQSGNLQAAQRDYTNIQQTAQQSAQQTGTQQIGGHHHGHHRHGGTEAASSSSSSSSQQSNPISAAFSSLASDLQAGNLSGAQSAFATLQNDLQQIGGFSSSGSNSSSPSSTASSLTAGGNLNVSA